jgi:large subunit ribosomal protein L21
MLNVTHRIAALPLRQLARRGLATQSVAPSASTSGAAFTAAQVLSTPAAASSPTHALALIHSQPSHYVVAAIAGRKYLLAPRDLVTVPRLNDVRVGDILALSDIHEVGSREYTLRGEPTLPLGTVNVQATVVEHTKGAMETIVKFKRRKGYRKTIKHKQTYTRLRIGPIELPSQPGVGE